MLAFSVKVNDHHIGICGFQDWSVLTATLVAGRGEREGALDGVELRVGGVETDSGDTAVHYLRHIFERLEVGDKVEIEIVNSAEVMEPIKRYWTCPGLIPALIDDYLLLRRQDYGTPTW